MSSGASIGGVTWDPNANALNLAGSLGVKADGEDLTWDLGILHGLGPAKSHKGSGLFSSSSHEHELDYEAKLDDKNRNLNRFTLIISGDYAELTLRDATTAIVATFSGTGQQTGLDSIYDGHWWRDPDFGTVKYYEKEKGAGPPEPIIEVSRIPGHLSVHADGTLLKWTIIKPFLEGVGSANGHTGTGDFETGPGTGAVGGNPGHNTFRLVIQGSLVDLILSTRIGAKSTTIVGVYSGAGVQDGLDGTYTGTWWDTNDKGGNK
ncbi:hypothetical protein SISNIDRAFT_490016 [Sistotremastrum niveocremeum HHB9708]|uniref:Uncharacterized protein n=1 Tax=Sistotremastrum niveocremeum HHB9708 TaxID=1314777 RepID=A0A164PCH8_9AGAM|nr:hypothetical protein SISNIDRAFT_490016 [Sistotremastrum niveocremeum HHB9708]